MGQGSESKGENYPNSKGKKQLVRTVFYKFKVDVVHSQRLLKWDQWMDLVGIDPYVWS
jgi:hypothetical protein